MLYSSKGLALILSLGISLATVLFLFLFTRPGTNILVAAGLVGFLVSFALIFLALDSLIFRQVKKVKAAIHKTASNEDASFTPEDGDNSNLKEVMQQVVSYAERKQNEIDELERREVFRKDFIADISHELKTPIFAAQGFVHTLLDGAVKDKTVRKKFLKKAAKSLDGLDILVQDLLTLSQIETRQIRMHFEEFDLYSLTEEVLDQFREKSSKKDIALIVKGPVRKVLVYADAQRISQVMANLVSNAIKHSSSGGKVEISFTVKKKSVAVRVRDFGEGIPEEHLQRIFERFYRVDKSRSREKGGTGLGLAIVKHILEEHKSKPKVESTAGKGAAFSFRLARALNEETANGAQDNNTED